MTQTQQPYDEWNQEVTLFLADHVDHWLKRALEELRKRDRALEIAKEALRDYKYHSSKTDCVTQYSEAAEALKQIEEVLK